MQTIKHALIAAAAVAAAIVSPAAIASDRAFTAREISEAIMTSPLRADLQGHANIIGRFAAIVAGGQPRDGRFGVMSLNRSAVASVGLTPGELIASDLQRQVDLWAGLANHRFEQLTPAQRRGLSAKGGPYCVFDLDAACLTRKGAPLARWASLEKSSYFRAEIADAIKASDLHPVLKFHADAVARLALSHRGKADCCVGRLRVHRADLAEHGLGASEFEYMSLQEQVDVWAAIANRRFAADQIGPIYATPEMLLRLRSGA
ncbi:hypothetical protein [Bosea beijingensis]|uniref:hypothetical protein n=1 Tax=Bosea beijingensis TaxID=3068632 RepID=UPI0027415836|nr:hypothetical protein [Bosea sp. REN20]